MTKRLHITVKGKVQGVFYRDSTQKKARQLGVSGYVRNLRNGDVEMVIQGGDEEVQLMKKWCWTGSPHSNVTDVIVREENVGSDLSGFNIKY